MKKILDNYEKLNVVRAELQEFRESIKDNPLKQLQNFGTESVMFEKIDELRKAILKDSRKLFEGMTEDPKAVEFVNRFKAIDDTSKELQDSTRKMTASSHNESLDYLKGLTKLHDRNELLEEIVETIKSTQPSKSKKKKM
jgi:hypothetical protein